MEIGVLNEFAAGAYRLHGMIQETYPLVNSQFQEVNRYRFIDGVNNINHVLNNIDAIYRYLKTSCKLYLSFNFQNYYSEKFTFPTDFLKPPLS